MDPTPQINAQNIVSMNVQDLLRFELWRIKAQKLINGFQTHTIKLGEDIKTTKKSGLSKN